MKNKKTVNLTMLNFMAGQNIEESFDNHVSWNIRLLDLKEKLYGKSIEKLTVDEAIRIRSEMDSRGLRVQTFSTCLFKGSIEQGEESFRNAYEPDLENVLLIAKVLEPVQIRLLAASTEKRGELLDSHAYITRNYPWLFNVYRSAIDKIHAAGFTPVIENEIHNCIFSKPAEVIAFFNSLDRSGKVKLIWDIQNFWQMGTYPSLEVYETLKPHIGMLHVKGGRSNVPGGPLFLKSDLEHATWPVIDILQASIRDGITSVICINPSHGRNSPEYGNVDVKNEIDFLRTNIGEIA